MMKTTMTLCTLLIVLVSLYGECTAQHYVYPTEGSGAYSCLNGITTNGLLCRNLSYYITHFDTYFIDDTVFYFYPGTHVLEGSSLVEVVDVNNVSLQGLGQQMATDYPTLILSTVEIYCHNNSSTGFSFTNSSDVFLSGLTFTNCGGDSDVFGGLSAMYSLVFESVTTVTMEAVSVYNTTSIGVVMTECANIDIRDCSFAFNQASLRCVETDYLCGGGNVAILYPSYSELPVDRVNVSITNSNFSYGFSTDPGQCGGLTFDYGITAPLSVVYDGLVAHGNTGVQGGNFYIYISSEANFTFDINSVIATNGNSFYQVPTEITDNIQQTGAGFRFLEASFSEDQSRHVNVRIANSEFSHGIAYAYGGLSLSWLTKNIQNTKIELVNCTFTNNTGRQGAGLYMYAQRSLQSQDLHVIMTNITARNNMGFIGDSGVNSALMVQNVYIEVEDLAILDNELTGLTLIGSILAITGNSSFIGNRGIRGGGLALYESSVILLNPPVYMTFINNTATLRGGGVFVDQISFVSEPDCFYQVSNDEIGQRPIMATMYFNDNTAGEAGDVLFGGDVNQCTSSLGFFQLFEYSSQTGVSLVSSNAQYVCFCTNESVPDCDIDSRNMSVYAGQRFDIQLVAVGQLSGTVSGVMLITDNTDNATTTRQTIMNLDSTCNSISYSINVIDKSQVSSTLTFTIESSSERALGLDPIELYLSIIPCPPGFLLDSIRGECVCIGVLDNIQTVVCDSTTEEMSREGSVWMGYNTENHCTIVREDCPYDYCNTSNVTFSIVEPDPQCSLDRAGVMCGRCADGYSLKIGSNSCGQCSNVSLLLILFFGVAGILIVVVITLLNMTLSVGTINGLIFYGNVVKINEEIFFPNGPIPFLSQFISWINLDFGIEACFYDGMTPITKAWLLFVFPIYLWLIVLIIILLSRFSSKISKAFGSNSLSVLATLILLSYAKLFRAIINALVGTRIQCGPHITLLAWYVDPNVSYNDPSHLVLVIIAGVFLFGLCLPYTIVFLFNQLIIVAMTSNWCVKLGCNKTRLALRLFFDAHNAPYKPNWRSWTGILLTFRFIIVLVIAFSSNNDTLLSTSCLLAILVSIFAAANGVYKQRYLNILEVWFIFNLLFMVAFADKQNSDRTQVVSAVSAALSLVTFIGIILFHVWMKIEPTKFGQRLKMKVLMMFPSKRNSIMTEGGKEDIFMMSGSSDQPSSIRSTSIGVDLRRRETLLQDLLGSSSTVGSDSVTATGGGGTVTV